MSDPFVALQRILPQHWLSRFAGRFTGSTHPWISRPLIRAVSAAFKISLGDAARQRLDDYASFDDFFTRELAPGARPMPDDPALLVSPADGTLSQFGRVAESMLVQTKGVTYSLGSLLGDSRLAHRLDGGWFATIYLAPADYHRVHMPLDGTLRRTIAIPGQLFSVNARTESGLTDLFCRNERLVCQFDTAMGTLFVVMVGALIVASIETVWAGPQSPYRRVESNAYTLPLARGTELGRFKMGSTVIVIAPPGTFAPSPALEPSQRLEIGHALGRTTPAPAFALQQTHTKA